jgi:hypothetical protein
MPFIRVVPRDNELYWEIAALKNLRTKAYINAGTVQFTQVRRVSDQIAIAGISFPVAFTLVAGSTTGEWETTTGGALALAAGVEYEAQLDINPGGSPSAQAWVPFVAEPRKA